MQALGAAFFEVYIGISQCIYDVSLVYEFQLSKQCSFCMTGGDFSVAC